MLNYIRRTIYKLKRQFGRPIDLYIIENFLEDLETGAKDINKTVYHIKRSIEYNNEIGLNRLISYLNKVDAYSLTNNIKKTFLIDKRDIPRNLSITISDYIVSDHKRFNIIAATIIEESLYLLNCEGVEDAKANEVSNQNLSDDITLAPQLNRPINIIVTDGLNPGDSVTW